MAGPGENGPMGQVDNDLKMIEKPIREQKIHPLAANWMITYKCTNNCLFCLTDSSPQKIENELDIDDKMRVIEIMSSLGAKRISVMGGEPFLLDEIEAIAKCAYLNKIIINLTTSGKYCNKQRFINAKDNLQYLNISIDGKEEYHDIVRGKGGFRLARQAVKDANEAGIKIRLYYVATTQNSDNESIDWIFKFASENGIFLIMFIFMSPTGRASKHWEYRVDSENREPILNHISNLSKKYKVAYKSCDPYLPERYKMFIEADGSVYKHAGRGEKFHLGHIIEQPAGDFWFKLTTEERLQHWDDFEGVKQLNPSFPVNSDLIPENMVYIPPGTFLMGSDFRERESPVHPVYLDGYFIDKYQVTNKQYADFLNQNEIEIKEIEKWINLASSTCLIELKDGMYFPKNQFENYPVVEVSWYGAKAYAYWLGKTLPTEAQWEKAALGGVNGKKFPWGNQAIENRCNWLNYNGKYKDLRPDFYHCRGPLPVGLFEPNEFGLFDMAGNVWEWCEDWHSDDYYKKDLMINPPGPETGKRKILKGGCWSFDPVNLRIANRSFAFPEKGYMWDGFRCVVSAIDLLKQKYLKT